MRGFHLLVMMVIGDSVKDTQCGFKVSAVISHLCGGWVIGGGEVIWGAGDLPVRVFVTRKQPEAQCAASILRGPLGLGPIHQGSKTQSCTLTCTHS